MDDGKVWFQNQVLQVGHEGPIWKRKQSFLETLHIAWRAIVGHDNLLARLVKLVKNMEEDFRVFRGPRTTSSRISKSTCAGKNSGTPAVWRF